MACDVRLGDGRMCGYCRRLSAFLLSMFFSWTIFQLSGVIGSASMDRSLSSKEMQAMLDLHNNYRALVALGRQREQPPAANMVALEWDDRQVKSAQGWADQCIGGHNVNKARRVRPYHFVGQDYAGNYSPEQSVKAWFDEVIDYTYDKNKCKKGSLCGHYTEVVWAKAKFVGCGQNKCKGRNSMTVVYCDYAPGGNVGHERPYEKGPACSKCPAGYGFCLGGALCASLRACTSGNKCVCTINSCKNGGQFDKATCFCKCPAGFMGRECAEVCKDTKSTCMAYKARGYCKWNSKFNIQMRKECTKTCGMCQYTPDLFHANKDKIHPRTPTGKPLDGPTIALAANHRIASVPHQPPQALPPKPAATLIHQKHPVKTTVTKQPHLVPKVPVKTTVAKQPHLVPQVKTPVKTAVVAKQPHLVPQVKTPVKTAVVAKQPYLVPQVKTAVAKPAAKTYPSNPAPDPAIKLALFSKIPSPVSHVLKKTAQCVDLFDHRSCLMFARAHYCHVHPNFMLTQCALSCNHGCLKTPVGHPPKPAAKPCVHNATNLFYDQAACARWAASGSCLSNAKFMVTQCAKACNVCLTPFVPKPIRPTVVTVKSVG